MSPLILATQLVEKLKVEQAQGLLEKVKVQENEEGMFS